MYERQHNPYQRNITIVKDYFKSPAVLALALLHIVSMIISVVSSFVTADLSKEVISKLADYFDANFLSANSSNDFLNTLSEAMHQVTISYGSVSAITVLTVVGLFLLYFKSRSEKLDDVPSAGVTLLYVLAIIALIFAILITIILIAGAVLLFFLYFEFKNKPDLAFDVKIAGSTMTFNDSAVLIAAIAFTIIAAGIIFFALFYAISRTRYLSSIRSSMNSVELSRKGAKPFGSFCVLCAVGAGGGLISSVVQLFTTNSKDALNELGIVINSDITVSSVIGIIASAVTVAIYILQAKIALGYARYIDDKKYGYDDPSDPAPYVPIGTSGQQNPYSYLAHQQNAANEDDSDFVNPYLEPREAAAQKTQATCPACGAKVDGNAPFCGQCGSKL